MQRQPPAPAMATVGRQRLRARQVYVAVATSTCEDDGHCGCKGLWSDKGGSTCVLPPEIGKRLPTHSPSAFLKPPFQARLPPAPSPMMEQPPSP